MLFNVPENGINDVKGVMDSVFDSSSGLITLIIGIVLFFPIVEWLISTIAGLLHRTPTPPASAGIPQTQGATVNLTRSPHVIDLRGKTAGASGGSTQDIK